jgi:hypothetical protein
MLKKSTSVVLASFRPSTYPRGYASALHSLRPGWTAFLSILQKCSPVVSDLEILEILASKVVHEASLIERLSHGRNPDIS